MVIDSSASISTMPCRLVFFIINGKNMVSSF
jgi:hypothetical protein